MKTNTLSGQIFAVTQNFRNKSNLGILARCIADYGWNLYAALITTKNLGGYTKKKL